MPHRFKVYLLNEERSFLGHRVGDVLTSMQDIQTDLGNLGSRQLTRMAEDLVNQIRKILHSNWSPKSIKHLKELQRIGVAIQKTIEEKGDLKEILPAATQSLQQLSGKLGVKVNALDAPEQMPGEDIGQEDFALTGQGPQQGAPQGQQGPPAQQQGAPDQGQMPPQGPPQGAPAPQGAMPGMM